MEGLINEEVAMFIDEVNTYGLMLMFMMMLRMMLMMMF